MPHPTRLLTLLILFSLFGSVGCQSMQSNWEPKWPTGWPWKKKEEVAKQQQQVPERLVAIWSPDVLTQLGKRPARGFGGRLYFYNEANEAVEVSGQLLVYAYDDTDGDGTQELPSRKFAFTAEQFANHRSDSPLGPSYSIWLPWDGIDGYRRSISLVPVFTTTAGQVVMGQQAVNMLPGRVPEHQVKEQAVAAHPAAADPAGVQQASHAVAAARYPHVETEREAAQTGLEKAIRTTTITVPSSMKRRLAEPSGGGEADRPASLLRTPNPPFLHAPPAHPSAPLRSSSLEPHHGRDRERRSHGEGYGFALTADGPAPMQLATQQQGQTQHASLNFRPESQGVVPTAYLSAAGTSMPGYAANSTPNNSGMMLGQVHSLTPPTAPASVALQASLPPLPSTRSEPSRFPAPTPPDGQSTPPHDPTPRNRSGRLSNPPSEPAPPSHPQVPATWTNAARNAGSPRSTRPGAR